jgi:hypothetical protein
VHSAPQGVTLPEHVVSWDANRANNKWLRALRQRRQAWSAAWAAARAPEEETPSEIESSRGGDEEEDEDEKRGGNSPSSLSTT